MSIRTPFGRDRTGPRKRLLGGSRAEKMECVLLGGSGELGRLGAAHRADQPLDDVRKGMDFQKCRMLSGFP